MSRGVLTRPACTTRRIGGVADTDSPSVHLLRQFSGRRLIHRFGRPTVPVVDCAAHVARDLLAFYTPLRGGARAVYHPVRSIIATSTRSVGDYLRFTFSCSGGAARYS